MEHLQLIITFTGLMLLLHVVMIEGKSEGKYTEAANDQTIKKKMGGKLTHNQAAEKPFRSNKINLVWQKALKQMDRDDPAVQNLLRDLMDQDKLEMDLKKKKAANKDDVGEYDAIVRQKLLDILDKYGLGDHFPYDDETKKENEALNKDEILAPLRDKRLQKLWQKAKSAGFSDEELGDLKTELLHQQKKVNEYNALKHEVLTLDNVHENSLERLKRTEQEEAIVEQKRLDLKMKHREMKDGFHFVEASAKKVDEQVPDFSDPRVVDLWVQIRKGNFSSEELEGFKEELTHFERKIAKRKFLRDEMDAVNSDKMNIDTRKTKFDKENKLYKKIDDYDRKIKKSYGELKNRINAAMLHNEL